MTKAELVEDVARAAELTKKDAERLVEIVFESIIETLNQGEKIEVSIPAKRVPYFKPGKELKELINDDTPRSPASGGNSSRSISDDNRQPPLL
jgi:integration host factor subunit beta